MVKVARETAASFLEADVNGDKQLDFDEFISAIPMKTRELYTETALREAFDMADIDKSGFISMDEYFMWALTVAEQVGSGLEAIFRRYDASGALRRTRTSGA